MGFWENIDRTTVRELARAAGLRTSYKNAVEDLAKTYGKKPKPEFIEEFWWVLRDVWLVRSAVDRDTIVAKMKALGRGDTSIKTKNKAAKIDYLKTLRRSPALIDAVYEAFLASGAQERQETASAEPPRDSEEQEENFYAALNASINRLSAENIETMERAIISVLFSAASNIKIPFKNPDADTDLLVNQVCQTLLLDETWESTEVDLLDYQKKVLEIVPELFGEKNKKLRIERTSAMIHEWGNIVRRLFDVEDSAPPFVAGISSAYFVLALMNFPDDQEIPSTVIEGQKRFLSRGSENDESSQQNVTLDEVLTDIIAQVPNSGTAKVLQDDAGDTVVWPLYSGSAVIDVVRLPFDDGRPPLVRFISPLLKGVESSPELLDTLNRVNADNILFKLYWNDKTIIMEEDIAIEHFSEQLFRWQLGSFMAQADHFDTLLKKRFGGKTAGADKKAVFDV